MFVVALATLGVHPAGADPQAKSGQIILAAKTTKKTTTTTDDGFECAKSVTATGYRRITEGRAKESAERAWSNKVAALNGYGLAYTDLKIAHSAKTVCIKACAECTISKVCTVTADPCRPKGAS
jgi:hypothetical protein